ncbi:MAG TPA: discoidin domain-containing protein [Planctomycetaceae bacterium]|nr:discoidin domain-containing protein [Planctomycetaceae bacterium]
MRRLFVLGALALLILVAAERLEAYPPARAKTGLVPENLARGKPATASSVQNPERRPEAAVDGNPETRWCAADAGHGYWWQVDLQRPEDLTGCRIVWEFEGRLYQYKVEGSTDGKSWNLLADRTSNDDESQSQLLKFEAKGVRYVRLTITNQSAGAWASIFEFEALGTKLVEGVLPVENKPDELPRTIKGDGLLKGIKAPAGFDVTLFAAPPDIHYPTCICTGPRGEVYIGIDENGSLDAKPNRGRVVRCLDENGDGKADKFNVFAEMDSPRGLVFDHDTLYVLHPPRLTAFEDADGDGKAEHSETLVEGIGFDLKFRGADHTTNGIQMGIDGWIYVAVGDYGFIKAVGKDGRELQLHGGGIARVRADGTGLELVSHGQRNIYDVAIDPRLNLFTRDNTNDGGGWNVRLSHVIPGGEYGYPSLFVNFGNDIVQPLADYGGGSPTGSLYVQEGSLPAPFDNTLYTCDWGRSIVYRHPLEVNGAGFLAEQVPFLELPRPTDMEIDAQGRMYVTSWRDGGFNFSNPNVGYVIRVASKTAPKDAKPLVLSEATEDQLLGEIASHSHVRRLQAQRELLQRGETGAVAAGLQRLITTADSLDAKIAALFTLARVKGREARPFFLDQLKNPDLREFALRALADDTKLASELPREPLVRALRDENARVRFQAVMALERRGNLDAAADLVPLTADADPLVAHRAVHALVSLQAIDACLAALDAGNPATFTGACRALREMHDSRTVSGLIERLPKVKSDVARRDILLALCRLYNREADWDGKWWGTRPDTTGPYFKPVTWSDSNRIGEALQTTIASADSNTLEWLLTELVRHRVDLGDTTKLLVKQAESNAEFRPKAVALLVARSTVPAEAVGLLEKTAQSSDEPALLRAQAIRGLEKINQPTAREATQRVLAAVGRTPSAPGELKDVWREYVRDGRNGQRVADFVALAEKSDAAERELALAVLLQIEGNQQLPADQRGKASAAINRTWNQAASLPALLSAIGQVGADRYAFQVQSLAKQEDQTVQAAAKAALARLGQGAQAIQDAPADKALTAVGYDKLLDEIGTLKGDAGLGARLFERQGCVACHTTSPTETPKGPFLGGISTRYNRRELTESILKPSTKIAQGFETQWFLTDSGKVYDGFVVRESGDEVELRNAAGVVTILPKSEIEERGKRDLSMMPTGLVDRLSPEQFASLLVYLESLKAK